jgi:hypothetical protein
MEKRKQHITKLRSRPWVKPNFCTFSLTDKIYIVYTEYTEVDYAGSSSEMG